MESFALTPGEFEVRFNPCACPRDAAVRIVEAFQEAWRWIANAGHADSLTKMMEYWSQNTLPPFLVVLTTGNFSPAETGAKAEFIRFDYQRICQLPDPNWAVLVVAHELAHVWLYATNDSTHMIEPPACASLLAAWNMAREQRAHEIVIRWGFDRGQYALLIDHVKGVPVCR